MDNIDKAIDEVSKADHAAKYPIHVFCFPNGNTAVCVHGEQVPAAQQSWLLGIAANLINAGLDPLKAEITLPDGRTAYFFRCGDLNQLNWNIEGS